MLSAEEEKFVSYWAQNRDREKKLFRQLLVGLPLGLFIGIAIIASLKTGWYERANMEANAEMNPGILFIAILAIIVFTSIFWKKYKWDMNEQRYKELLYKKQKLQVDEAAKENSI